MVDAIHHFAEKIHKRSLVIIFSDMLDPSFIESEEAFRALQHLRHKNHDVVLFHVMDKEKEVNFDFENRPFVFIDNETGEEIKLNPTQVQEKYQKDILEYYETIKNKCFQYKIDYFETDVNQGFMKMFLNFIIKRGRMF